MSKKEPKKAAKLAKTSTKKQHNYAAHNKKVASLRSKSWQKNLSEGRFKVMLNPSKIRSMRLLRKMNQDTMIQGTPIKSISSYSRIEKAMQPVSKELAQILATRLKVNIGDIFTTHKDKKLLIAKF